MKLRLIVPIVVFILFFIPASFTGYFVFIEKENGEIKLQEEWTRQIHETEYVSALVSAVIDGDTIDLENFGRVRLSGINAPETGECYYEEAKYKLEELILGKEVYLEKDITDEDKYGRKLRYVYIDDLLVNKLLIEQGYAKVYDKYENDTKRYDELKEVEKIAINNSLGAWGCEDSKKDCLYVGSKNSNIYHLPDCKWAKRIKPENLICYKSEDEVKDLERCKTCLR